MEQKETFKMTYSARQQEEVHQIRSKYIPREPDKMAQLRALDAAVGNKATAVSIAVGIVGTLLLGVGMSLIMSEFGTLLGALALPVGIATGAVGLVILACAYPVYLRTLKKERAKAAPEILRLSEALMR